MLPYIAVLALFWGGATFSFINRERYPVVLALMFLVFVLFAGTRYETGFDWLVYELALNEVPTLTDLFGGAVLQETARLMEPLFLMLLSALKSMDLGIQTLYFLVALFNGAVLIRFFQYTRTNIAVGLAVYFSWSYLVVQMAVMRQSLAVSFLLLAIMAFDRRRLIRSAIFMLMGVFVQYSLVLFLPIFFTGIWRRLIAWRLWIVGALSVFLLSGTSMFGVLGTIASLIPNAFIAGKLAGYAALAPSSGFSPTAVAYFALHGAIFLILARIYDSSSRMETVLMGSMFMMIMAQALVPEFPLLWNRLHYFVIVAQIVMLFRRWETLPQMNMRAEFLGVYLVSLAMFGKLILGPGIEPYLPYQSYLVHEWTGAAGDGRERAENYYMEFNSELLLDRKERGVLPDTAAPSARNGEMKVYREEVKPSGVVQ